MADTLKKLPHEHSNSIFILRYLAPLDPGPVLYITPFCRDQQMVLHRGHSSTPRKPTCPPLLSSQGQLPGQLHGMVPTS